MADKLAEFVAKNGRNFEDVTRERNAPDGPFRHGRESASLPASYAPGGSLDGHVCRFLFEVGSHDHHYYLRKLHEAERRISSQAAGLQPKPAPPPFPEPVALPPLPSARYTGKAAAAAALQQLQAGPVDQHIPAGHISASAQPSHQPEPSPAAVQRDESGDAAVAAAVAVAAAKAAASGDSLAAMEAFAQAAKQQEEVARPAVVLCWPVCCLLL